MKMAPGTNFMALLTVSEKSPLISSENSVLTGNVWAHAYSYYKHTHVTQLAQHTCSNPCRNNEQMCNISCVRQWTNIKLEDTKKKQKKMVTVSVKSVLSSIIKMGPRTT